MTCLYYLAAWLLVALITGVGLCRGIHQRKVRETNHQGSFEA